MEDMGQLTTGLGAFLEMMQTRVNALIVCKAIDIGSRYIKFVLAEEGHIIVC